MNLIIIDLVSFRPGISLKPLHSIEVKNCRRVQRLPTAIFANAFSCNMPYALWVTACGRNLLFCISSEFSVYRGYTMDNKIHG